MADIFISYAHEDREWCERLLNHLGWLRHTGGFAVFEDKQIKPGEAWDARIRGELSQAAVVILLVSPHFIGSRYCSLVELLGTLETGKTIIPVLLDHVDLEPLPIAARQCLPKNEHQNLLPLIEWRNPNRALAAIAAAIRNEVAQLRGDAGPATQPLVPLPRREIAALGRAPVSLWLGRAAALLSLAASLAIAAGAAQTLPALGTARVTYSLLINFGVFALPGVLVLAQIAFELAHVRRTRRQRERALHNEVQDIGYFRLTPYTALDRDRFTRADRAHERILGWIESAPAPVLYLTGDSGVGKSSLLMAWLLPALRERGWLVQLVRGLDDPAAAITVALTTPGLIWKKPPAERDPARLIERAAQEAARQGQRLCLFLDQLEEVLLLAAPEKQQAFATTLGSVSAARPAGLTLLLALRTEYVNRPGFSGGCFV